MPLAPGTRFGPYEVAALIGVGGMGEVYRAADTNLKRDVAIKILPDFLLHDAERLTRFQREAEILAALNHQNIAHVYGLERTGPTTGLVMELVDGPSLADRIAQGPVPLAEALPIAMQIADALEAAHERSIVHRDLKPANIKLRPDGTVKILDFGIAKALQPVLAASGPRETQLANTPSMTQIGLILGTAAYMSPEQARGKFIDRRTDVWAFGCVLYEMLAGKPAFDGEDATTTVGRVLEREVDMSALPRDVPPVVRKVLTACLQKDAKSRIRDIGDVKLALGGAFETPAEHVAREPAWRRGAKLAAAAAIGAAAVGVATWQLWPKTQPRAITRLSMPVSVSLTNPHVAISADGQHVAYRNAAGLGIVVRDLDRFEPRMIAGTGDATQLAGCFSPDGSWLAFTAGVSGQSLKKVSLSGGGSVTVAQNLFQADICDWGSDGFIYFGADPGIMRVAEGGGTAELVAGRRGADGRATVENPKLLPGGKLLYTWYGNASLDTGSVDVMDLATRQTKTVLDAAGIASFLPWARDRARGYVLYGNQETLFAVPFDSRTLETGPIRPVVSDVYGIASLSSATVSASGTLAYLSAPGQRGPVGDAILIEMDRAGTERVLAEKPQLYGEITFAPDGRRASTAMVDASNATLADVWIYELDGDRFVRATFGGANVGVSWTADSQRLVYMHSGSLANIGTEIQTVAADGSGAPSTLIGNSSWMRGLVVPTSLGADGKVLLVANDVGANTDILAVDLDGTLAPLEPNRKPRDFLVTPFSETSAVLSPNGRYVAYTSNESGRNEIYVVPFPGPGAKSPVSRGGGNSPRWNRNGRELFYLNGDELVSVEVDTTGNFRALAPRALFKIPPLLAIRGTPYDVSPDGAHFLMLKAVTSGDVQQSVELRIVVNWIDELERAAPGRR